MKKPDFHFWKLAWRNLCRHWKRNLSTGLAIGAGFAGIVLLGGYLLRMEFYLITQSVYLNHVGHVAIYKPNGLDRHLSDPAKFNLTLEDQSKIMTGISELREKPEFISKSLEGQGLVSNGCQVFPFLALAVDSKMESQIRNHPEVLARVPELAQLKMGRGFWETPELPDGILISKRLAARLKKPLVSGGAGEVPSAMDALITDCENPESEKIISSHSGLQLIGSTFEKGIAATDARVSGHFTTGLTLSEDTAMLMPLALAQKFFDTDSVTFISIYLQKGSRSLATDVSGELQNIFLKHGWDFDVYPFYDERVSPYYVGAMTFVYVMALFFLILVCGVAALSILNSLQISFMERRTEVGTLRAIGYRPAQIVGLFAREIALLTGISLIGGGIAAALIAFAINAAELRFYVPGLAGSLHFLLKPGFVFSLIVGAIFFSVCMGAVFVTGRRWSKIKVVDLLENK
ncbi:MAG: hypothetical protein JWQ35_2360 [Bacteriovoracaceae bacterium]|nr:hypothetical protein [Bacteriovoracaceae bacterium]